MSGAKAAAKGRSLSYGIRLHVIVRETNAQAWRAMRHGKIITQVEIEQMNHRLESFGRDQGHARALVLKEIMVAIIGWASFVYALSK